MDSDHNCDACSQNPYCNHIRESFRDLDLDHQYIYQVTYVGEFAVVTGDSWNHSEVLSFLMPHLAHTTTVVRVMDMSIGDYVDHGDGDSVVHSQSHSLESATYTHDFIVMGLQEQMLTV